MTGQRTKRVVVREEGVVDSRSPGASAPAQVPPDLPLQPVANVS